MRSRRLITALVLATLCACNDNYVSSIPDTSVYLNLNIMLDSDYFTFYNAPGSYLTFTLENSAARPVTWRLGYGGLLLVHTLAGEFHAFDMACPKEAKRTVCVTVEDAMFATCASCGERYDLSSGIGNPTRRIGTENLRPYRTRVSGNYLTVTRD
ncbi:MAG: hypothetical protein IJ680_00615 [Paludibacteraceae bacterium]|nr:hypothetical protein [Paludibacteraceae bacterium]